MKPLVNLPSLGTFRTGPQWVVVFVVVLLGPFSLFALLVLAPILPTLLSAYRKQPTWAWRTALFASLTASFLIAAPSSPFCVGHHWPFALPHFEKQFGDEPYVFPSINLAIIAELPLLPLIVATAVHSDRERRRTTAGPSRGNSA